LYYALGLEENETMIKRHRVSLGPFLERWNARAEAAHEAAKLFDVSLLNACAECGGCEQDCPVAEAVQDFNPNAIVRAVAEGRIEEMLEQGRFWDCLDCLTCYEMCPQRFGMNTVFSKLKELATERGQVPRTLASLQDSFYEKGALASASRGLRKRLGLPDANAAPVEQLKQVLDDDDGKGED